MHFGNFIYRVVKRIIPLDITRVLFMPAEAAAEGSALTDNTHCRLLSKSELKAVSLDDEFSIDAQFLQDAVNYQVQAVGVVIDDNIVGLSCFAHGDVPGLLNTGGKAFQGIGIDLPPHTVYWFKVLIKQEQRGKRLAAKMIQFALQSHDVAADKSIITTTDITNTPFQQAVKRLGFKPVGYASEAILLGTHFFKLPGPVYSKQSGSSPELSKPIILKKPESKTDSA